ncbi:hypothetical protein QR77_30730 [Streptomyces sp. 150FB]|uniref:hypothetical protein n=1 Tax=Streptomyces sp. 150FB TaxID=1576605 RepID=UPI00058942B1|nr:hypothetical protein QR77_30730 [Streptomyces sp. 150FB]
MGENASNGGGSAGGGDIETEKDALTRFQTRVNTLLKNLESGAASGTKVAAQKVVRASLGGTSTPFMEADALYGQYNRVHDALVTLSKSLGDQIEGLSLGVRGAETEFANVDEDVRYRFAVIQTRIEEDHRKLRDDMAKEQGSKATEPAPKTVDVKQGSSDWRGNG